jgi:TatD DNase family protein
VGQHPYFYDDAPKVEALCASLFDHCRELGAVALGEFGVDKGRGGSIERQRQLFEAQLCLADELDLPVVLHQVGLQAEFLSSLKRAGMPRAGGVVHGFVGAVDWGRALMDRGFHLGIGVAITDDRRSKLASAVTELPLERLLIETDAPDQSPAGKKGAGVPGDLLLVRDAIARIRGTRPQEIAEHSEKSARALFRVEITPENSKNSDFVPD